MEKKYNVPSEMAPHASRKEAVQKIPPFERRLFQVIDHGVMLFENLLFVFFTLGIKKQQGASSGLEFMSRNQNFVLERSR